MFINSKRRGSAVGIATGTTIPGRAKNFHWFWGPSSYPMDTGATSPGDKAAGRAADHSPPSSAEVNKPRIYTLTLKYKHRNKLTFYHFVTIQERTHLISTSIIDHFT
jgi:hypothetical protein